MKKSLTKQLEDARSNAEYWRDRFSTLEKEYTSIKGELDRKKRDEMLGLEESHRNMFDANKQLFEIVRWLINKDTANHPFMPEKSQQAEHNRPRDQYGL